MSVRDVQESSVWEFSAQVDGFAKANGWTAARTGGAEISDERLAEMGIEGFV